MKRLSARISTWLFCLALLLGVLAWLTLYSPFFFNMRRGAVQDFLRALLGPLQCRRESRCSDPLQIRFATGVG